jgi:hypothetical protein
MKYFFITIFVLFFFACSGHLDKSINRDDYNDNDVNDVDDKKQDMDYKSLLNIEDVQLPQLPQLPNVSQCSKGWKKVCLKSNVCYCDFKINEEKCPNNWFENKNIIEVNPGNWLEKIKNSKTNSIIKFSSDIFVGNLKIENKNLVFIGSNNGTTIKSEKEKPVFENFNAKIKICNITFDSGTGIIANDDIFLTNVTVKNAKGIALDIYKKAVLNSVLIKNTKSPQTGFAKGVLINNGSNVFVKNLALLNNKNGAILVCKKEDNCNVNFSFDNILIKNTLPNKNQNMGYGMTIQGNTVLNGNNLTILDGKTFGLYVVGSKNAENFPQISIDNLIVNNILPQYDGKYGWGIYLENNQKTKFNKLFVAKTSTSGILVDGCINNLCKANIVVSNFVFQDINPNFEDDFGDGVVLSNNIFAKFSKGIVNNTFSYGILISNIENKNQLDVILDNVKVLNTKPSKNDNFAGFGLGIFQGSSVLLTKSEISNNFSAGILVYGNELLNTKLTASDLVVNLNKSRKSDGEFGAGIICAINSEISIKNSKISDNQESGIMCSGNSKAVLNKVIVSKTKPRECFVQKNCSYSKGVSMGQGLTVFDSSVVILQNSIFENNITGLQFENSTAILPLKDKKSIVILKNDVGINSWNLSENFDIQKTFSNSIFDENKTRFVSDKQSAQKPVDFSKN